ncbi:DUF1801 domain-containing protein [Lampropedia puyangensis]|uniref:DUF1801 domain-containing protein n=1 Tax=Lampropedia puyangensis TaxID=1330072 RepID=A0A4S8FES6_9BURK|nr:DUF1801 domain-containing protein [Lampropedia puyangensis]THU05375.1 DUF1801 domain-containing protein [Lampropedia puyangensis]
MTTDAVAALLEDIRVLGENQHQLVQTVRMHLCHLFPAIKEEVKYGGIVFSQDGPFCGVYAYTQHVSVELSQGAKIRDAWGFLQGSGQFRRHLKLRCMADVAQQHLDDYLLLAYQATKH